MADPTGGSDVAQIIAAGGTAFATMLGAIMLWPTRRRRERAAAAADVVDAEDRPARLRERLTKLETRDDEHDRRLDHVEEEVALLRAQEVTAEALTPRPRPPRRRS